MANSKSSATSILGIIALILVIVAAGYYIINRADDDEIEVDIGVVDEAAPSFLASSAEVVTAQVVI